MVRHLLLVTVLASPVAVADALGRSNRSLVQGEVEKPIEPQKPTTEDQGDPLVVHLRETYDISLLGLLLVVILLVVGIRRLQARRRSKPKYN
jgi:hypothetical protein